jgi:DNA polymerase III alpha subunit (gram-positive type)
MNRYNYVVFDFETGGDGEGTALDTNVCIPLQLAAVAIDARSLKIVDEFASYISPGIPFEKLGKDALQVNKITESDLKNAANLDTVWKLFVTFVNRQSNKPGNGWEAPIPVGHNIKNYDIPIINRLCSTYGNVDKKSKKPILFNWRHMVDTVDFLFPWLENQYDIDKYNFDVLREYLGLSKTGAHNAITDVKQCADVFVRFLNFHRKIVATKGSFKGAFNESLSKQTRNKE